MKIVVFTVFKFFFFIMIHAYVIETAYNTERKALMDQYLTSLFFIPSCLILPLLKMLAAIQYAYFTT